MISSIALEWNNANEFDAQHNNDSIDDDCNMFESSSDWTTPTAASSTSNMIESTMLSIPEPPLCHKSKGASVVVSTTRRCALGYSVLTLANARLACAAACEEVHCNCDCGGDDPMMSEQLRIQQPPHNSNDLRTAAVPFSCPDHHRRLISSSSVHDASQPDHHHHHNMSSSLSSSRHRPKRIRAATEPAYIVSLLD